MLFLITVLLLAAGLFYWAGANMHHGIAWADRVCAQVGVLCEQPWWLLVTAAVVLGLTVTRRARRA